MDHGKMRMKYLVFVLVLVSTAILVFAAEQEQGAGQGPKSEKDKDEEPLLLLDDDPPLLLDDDEDDPSAKGGKIAKKNKRCFVCHLNFADEEIATVHAKNDMACTECHGDCDEHIADESWATGGNGTAPGKMYLRKDIDACCLKCHKEHDVSAQQVIAHWQKRCAKKPPPGGVDLKTIAAEKIVCTDCHGDHHMYLEERKCTWK